MTLHSIAVKSVPNGTKFVALYADGSGAKVFMVDKAGNLVDCYGKDLGDEPDATLVQRGFASWLELPQTFNLWFDQHRGFV